MQSKLIFLSFFLLHSYVGLAQHCPFDATGIIVLNIHAIGDSTQIPGLKITVQGFDNGAGNIFWQNPTKTTLQGNIVANDSALLKKYNFPFAGNNYVLVCGYLLSKQTYNVLIEDVDGTANGGQFESKWIKLSQNNVFSLCGTYRLKSIPRYWKNAKTNYEPINIPLELTKQGVINSH